MYGWRSVSQSVANNSRVPFLTGNSQRVSLFVAVITSGILRIASSSGPPGVSVWGTASSQGEEAFVFRDYGPIIQAEVWLENVSGGAITAVVTELYRISEC